VRANDVGQSRFFCQERREQFRDALGVRRAVAVRARDGGVAMLKAIAEILHVQPPEPRVALAKKAAAGA